MHRELAVGVCMALCASCSIQADLDSSGFRCDVEPRCPSGQSCIDGFCSAGGRPDAAPVDPFLAPWAETSLLPAVCDYNHQHAAALNGFVYLIGGYDPELAEVATVYHAQVNGDGTLGSWGSTTPILAPRALSDVVVADGVIYVIGGADQSRSESTTYYAPVAGDGTIAEWTATSMLQSPRKAHCAVLAGDHVYVIGGGTDTNQRVDTVFVAEIQAGGGLDAWRPARSLPEPLANAGCVYVDGVIYVVGGDDIDELPSDAVYHATVGEDGALGPWATAPALPTARRWGTAVHDAGYLYYMGGSGAVETAEVLHARIEADGGLGEWELDTALPAPRARHAVAVVDGVIYVLGGIGAAEVLYADTPDP